MDSLWDVDYRSAISTIEELRYCIDVLSSKRVTEDTHKYAAITRAKLSTLRKTISNLELCLRNHPSDLSSSKMVDQRRAELERIKRTQEELERAMEQQSSYVQVPESKESNPREHLHQMKTSDLYDYRRNIMRQQDRELELLDTTADAIKSISSHIRDETDLQMGLLGDLESAVDTSHDIVSQNRATFTQIIERSSKGRLMFYIVILAIILILLLVL